MIKRTVLRSRIAPAARFASLPQRWVSYDRAALTKGALGEKVEAGLGDDSAGKPLRIDTENKTISTAVGDLPISPLFSPDWMKARRRQRKDDAGKPKGRFRQKLAQNPYARALASPIRRCPNTATSLPRYFLQDFELVRHPETDAPWWVPGPLAFEQLQQNDGPEQTKSKDSPDDSSSNQTSIQQDATKQSARSPMTGYVLCRKSVVDRIGGPNKRYAALLQAVRTGLAAGPSIKNAVWRPDMGDVLLHMMRRRAVDALIAQAASKGKTGSDNSLIQPVASLAEARHGKNIGCLLWMPLDKACSPQYATLDVEGAKYGRKVAVHNLHWMLGDSEVSRLRESSDMFKDNEVLVLQPGHSSSVTKLHQLLWRLQGYIWQGLEV